MSASQPSSTPQAHAGGAGRKSGNKKKNNFQKKVPSNDPPNPTGGMVPILRPPPNSNFDVVKRLLTYFGEREAHLAGRCFRDGEYPVAEEDPDYSTDEDDATEEEKKRHGIRWSQDVSDHRKLLAKLKEECTRLFAIMEGLLSPESADLVRNHADWPQALAARSPLLLMHIMTETHRQGNHGVGAFDVDAAQYRYNALRMYNSEQLSVYSLRFQAAIEDLQSVGATVPSTSDQVIRFIQSLPTFYDPIKQHFIQRARENGDLDPIPATLGEATQTILRLARELSCNITPRSTSSGTVSAVAYHAKSEQQKKQAPNNKKGNDGKKSCPLCDATDHWANACPSLVVAKAAVQASNHHSRVTFVINPQSCLSMRSYDNDVTEHYVLLDTQSTLHLFCDKALLSNVHSVDTILLLIYLVLVMATFNLAKLVPLESFKMCTIILVLVLMFFLSAFFKRHLDGFWTTNLKRTNSLLPILSKP